MPARRAIVLVLLALAALPACDSLYYRTMKRFGLEKRDILVRRVRDAREAQQKGKEEFRSALERFRTVVETEGGTLEENTPPQPRAGAQRGSREADSGSREGGQGRRRRSVQGVGEGAGPVPGPAAARESQRELRATRQRAGTVITAMEKAQERVDPVLQRCATASCS